jgi:tight adherence protein B
MKPPTLTFLLAGMALLLWPPALVARQRLAGMPIFGGRMLPPLSARRPTWRASVRRCLASRLLGPAGALVVAALAGGLVNPLLAIPGAFAGWLLVRVVLRSRDGRRADRNRQELSAVVDGLTAEYTAGATIAAALTVVAEGVAAAGGSFSEALGSAARAATEGTDLAEALVLRAELAELAVVFRLAEQTGSGLSGALAGLQAELAADHALRRATAQLLAGPRASSMLLALLPVLGIALGAGLGANPAEVLLHQRIGVVCLAAGVLLDLMGLSWTMALTRRVAA